jgi:hypothetical protein
LVSLYLSLKSTIPSCEVQKLLQVVYSLSEILGTRIVLELGFYFLF